MRKEIKKAPTIRFRGFTDDWEQRKIFELFKITRGHVLASPLISDTKTGDKPYPVFSSQTKNNGLMGYYKDYLYQDAITWTTDGANAGTVNYRAEKFYCTNVCGVLLADKVIPNQMIAEALNKVAKRHVSYVGNPKLMNNVMADIEITLPDDENERKRISYLFDKIDNLIPLHQRKLDQLKKLKKYFLQNMFPAKGEKVPRIRFKGFTGDWEQRKLGDLGKARSGIGFPNDEQGGKDGIPFYKVSDMNNAGNEHEMITANNYVTREQIARKGWSVIEEVPAIFFAKVGAAVLLNRKRLCRFPFLLDNNTMAYSIDRSVLNTDFAKTLFETIDLTALIQVGALPSYNAGDVENVNVVIPRMAEQKKIGANFKKLDNLITLHQCKLDQLQTMKKFMLQNLFI